MRPIDRGDYFIRLLLQCSLNSTSEAPAVVIVLTLLAKLSRFIMQGLVQYSIIMQRLTLTKSSVLSEAEV